MVKKIGENKKINNMRNYLEWNKEMSEKIIDLGVIYDTYKQIPDDAIRILRFETRESTTNGEIKICKLISKLTGTVILLEHPTNFHKSYEFNRLDVFANTSKGVKYLRFNNFPNWNLVIKIKKITYSPDDPYGEENWDE